MSIPIRRRRRLRAAVTAAIPVAAVSCLAVATPAVAAPHPHPAAHHPAASHPASQPSRHQAGTRTRDAGPGKRGSDPTIIINTGGDRTAAGPPAGLEGVTFRATGDSDGVTNTCTTDPAGTCSIPLTTNSAQTYTITPISEPAGWFRNEELGVYNGVPIPAGTQPQPYATMTTGTVQPGATATVTVPTQNATPPNSGTTLRNSQLAFSRTDPPEERKCGQNIAMLFDLSSSITSPVDHLQTYKNAGKAFVEALRSTPSHVALYSFGTNANLTGNNGPLPLQPTNTGAGQTALQDHIQGMTVTGAQYTNWDAGLWQIAQSTEHYNLVVMLTDGDPTAQGRPNASTPLTLSTTFQKVENGIYSANAVKHAENGGALKVVGVEVPSAASHANLRAISGDGDFIGTDFTHLADELKAVALDTCYGLQIHKTATPSTYTHVGQEITYHYTVTNTGQEDLPLHNIMVHDDHVDHPIVCMPSTIRPGGQATCTATYTITQADLDRGHVTNTAHATGTTDEGDTVTSDDTEATVRHPAISIVKRAWPTQFGVAGEKITYTFDVKNTGQTPLRNVHVQDSLFGHIVCDRNELGVGESMECHYVHYTTEEDVERGSIHNTVRVTGVDPENREVSDDSEFTVDHVTGPHIELEKVAFPTQYGAAGEVITYTYRVVNTGTVTLHDVSLHDSRLGGVTCPSDVLEPGHEMDCTGHHTITADDIAAGHIHNVATVSGHDPESGRTVTDTDDATVTHHAAPGIQIEKEASPVRFTGAGQTIHYTYRAANTGNVTLHNVSVYDSKVGLVASCDATTLHPGEETTCRATYTTTQADVERGYIPNFAYARGVKPDGNSITSAPAEAIVTGPQEVPVTG